MSLLRIAGIDPGVTGALALLWADKPPVISDLPIVGEPKNRVLSVAVFAELLTTYAPDHVFIEEVNCIPVWGAKANWQLSAILNCVRGVVGTLKIPMTFVRAKVWQQAASIKANDGELSRKRALELYPTAASFLARVKDHNRAEALLIAHYGTTQHP